MTLSIQFYTLLAMVGMGTYVGVILDTYQRFLKRTKRKQWIVFINDIVFWCVQGMLVFLVLFLLNRGELRIYIFLALLLGFSMYKSLLQNFYVRQLEIGINIAKKIIHIVHRLVQALIITPVQWIYRFVVQLITFVVLTFYQCIRWILMVLLGFIQWFFRLFLFFVPKSWQQNVEKKYVWAKNALFVFKNRHLARFLPKKKDI